jgi:hypothetical protein
MVWDLLSTMDMKTISFKAIKNGHGYITSTVVPANSSEARIGSAWGLVIAGGLVLITATFVCLLLLGSR